MAESVISSRRPYKRSHWLVLTGLVVLGEIVVSRFRDDRGEGMCPVRSEGCGAECQRHSAGGDVKTTSGAEDEERRD